MVSSIISISIIFIFLFSFTADFLSTTKKLMLKIGSIILLSYALYMNYTETNILIKNIPDLFSNQNIFPEENSILSLLIVNTSVPLILN